ncbi:MAG: PAS domain S-box protein [Cyanosarcina radialis HA8281-LM2]|jgi:PAS domain S-box-containing protein|nr:PAS domain S-box protein [Cyanosarcina radialis HA8281-LM2]
MRSTLKAPVPDNEKIRLKVLRQSQILDTSPEQAFDDLTHLAAYICGTPIALVSLIDAHRQWFKSKVGLDIAETPRDIAFCAHTVGRSEVLVVSDALKDERFAANPLVTKDPKIRFYAGAPLVTSSGEALGTLCVIDYVPREMAPEQLDVLQELAREAVTLIQLRRNISQLARTAGKDRPAKQQRRGFFPQIGLGFGLASAVLLGIGLVAYRSLTNFIATSQWQIQHYQVLQQTEKIDISIHQAILAQHRYLISGEDRHLEPYYEANEVMDGEIAKLQHLILTSDRPLANRSEQLHRVTILDSLINRKLAQIDYLSNIRKTKGLTAGSQAWREYQPVPVTQQIETTLASIEASENQLLNERSLLVETNTRWTLITFLTGIFVTFALLTWVYYLIYREIRRRHQIEARLEESEEKHRSVVENIKEVIFQTDDRGYLTFLNPAWAEITGYPIADSLNTPILDYIYPSDRQQARELFQQLITGQKPDCRCEHRYVTQTGRVGWLEVYAQPILDRDRQIVGAFGTLNDISDRHQTQEVMQRQLAAVEAAIDGIAIFNVDSEFIYINQAHWEMFGYKSAEELLGKTWRELYRPDEIDRFEKYVFPILWQQGRWRGEATGKRADGQTFAEEVSLTLLENGHLICVCRNISKRKQAEAQLKTSLQEKEVLLKEVHHRVKNNLQVIDSLFRHQCRSSEDPKLIQTLRECQNRVMSMALIHEKLYQSKDLDNIIFCDYVQSLLANLLEIYTKNVNAPELHIKVECVKLDISTSLNCGLIINELVSNCFKYAFPHGDGGEIEVQFTRDLEDRCMLKVKDNGVGMPADFDLENLRSLGLKIVKILTKQLDGEIKVNSENGTEFLITFIMPGADNVRN